MPEKTIKPQENKVVVPIEIVPEIKVIDKPVVQEKTSENKKRKVY
jgi:hypothetical protein